MDPTSEQMEELHRQVNELLEAIRQANRWTSEHTPDKKHPVPVRMGPREWLKFIGAGLLGLAVQTAIFSAWVTHQWDGHETRLLMLERQNAQEDTALNELLRITQGTQRDVTRIEEHIKGVDEHLNRLDGHSK